VQKAPNWRRFVRALAVALSYKCLPFLTHDRRERGSARGQMQKFSAGNASRPDTGRRLNAARLIRRHLALDAVNGAYAWASDGRLFWLRGEDAQFLTL
jgi:hypothetical protein